MKLFSIIKSFLFRSKKKTKAKNIIKYKSRNFQTKIPKQQNKKITSSNLKNFKQINLKKPINISKGIQNEIKFRKGLNEIKTSKSFKELIEIKKNKFLSSGLSNKTFSMMDEILKTRTKKEALRTEKILQRIKDKDFKGLSRFKEFKGIKPYVNEPDMDIGTALRSLRSDADFYFENRKLISEVNKGDEASKKQLQNIYRNYKQNKLNERLSQLGWK